jgi:hypothetical protein
MRQEGNHFTARQDEMRQEIKHLIDASRSNTPSRSAPRRNARREIVAPSRDAPRRNAQRREACRCLAKQEHATKERKSLSCGAVMRQEIDRIKWLELFVLFGLSRKSMNAINAMWIALI